MLPQISKEVISNFDNKYQRRSIFNRHLNCITDNTNIDFNSNKLVSANITVDDNIIRDIESSEYTCCYGEDYMLTCAYDSILILLHSWFIDKGVEPWN